MALLSALFLIMPHQTAAPAQSDAEPVRVLTDRIEFIYEDPAATSVSLRLSVDGFRQTYRPGSIDSESGRFVFTFMLRGEGSVLLGQSGTIEYLYTIDGVTMADPRNPNQRLTAFGTQVSQFTFQSPTYNMLQSPQIRPDGKVAFLYRGSATTPPVVSGTFNGWHPRALPMERLDQETWVLEVELPAGEHYYHFIVEGERELDPLNGRALSDRRGYPMSVLQVPAHSR